MLQNWWLSVWAGQTQAAGDHLTGSGLHYYLGMYSLIGFAALGCQMIRGIFLLLGMLNASKLLHSNLIGHVRDWPWLSDDGDASSCCVPVWTANASAWAAVIATGTLAGRQCEH